jgi:hypothetical protein
VSKTDLSIGGVAAVGSASTVIIHATRRGSKQETHINVVQRVLNLLHATVRFITP